MSIACSTRCVTTPRPRPVTRPISGRVVASPVRTRFTMRSRLVTSSVWAPKRRVDSRVMHKILTQLMSLSVDFDSTMDIRTGTFCIVEAEVDDDEGGSARMTWGVGVIGAGPGVAALHLPTLERLRELFSVVHVADNGGGRAAELAARVGATASQGAAELLADPAVDVVAICSPPGEHARQIREAIAAGKRAILCEKPLATSEAEAEEVVDACRRAGVVLFVATNHLYD